MAFPELTWVLILVAAVLCAIGFYKFVYFMSVGYGLAVAGIGAAVAIIGLARGQLTAAAGVLCLLLIVYGVRLGGFLLVREIRSAGYRKAQSSSLDMNVPLPLKLVMWLFMSVLYFMEACPVWYRVATGTGKGEVLAWVGALVMACGIYLEAEADRQKSAAKKKNPGKPAMEGLYKLCRCPNYFGEMTFWTGVFISGLNIFSGLQWAVAVIGYVCIIFIMISGARRLETRQNKNYGGLPEYREYVEKTPILLPFVPLYHLTK